MPRRLLLAADIVADVAGTLRAEDRAILRAVVAELREKARSLAASRGMALELSPEMDRLTPTIRRLAASLDPESEHRS